MKKLEYSLSILLILFTIGCEDEEVDPLVGVYNIVQSKSISSLSNWNWTRNADANNDLVLTLAENGTYSRQGKENGNFQNNSGTWSTNGNKLTLADNDEEEGTTDWDYTLSNGILTKMSSYEYEGSHRDYTFIWEKE